LLGALGLGGMAVLGALAGCSEAADPNRIDLATARADLEAGRAILVDIREPAEHATGIAPGARPIPMRQLAARWSELGSDPTRPVYLICATQNRSSATQRALSERGVGPVRYVHGGMRGWAERGWPLVRP
jgi:rhodanese-related sulfurtransferase